MITFNRLSFASSFVGTVLLTICGVASAADDEAIELNVGEPAPRFESEDDRGMSWKLGNYVGRKFVVVYFYPADFTTGCTRQAVAWRDNMNELVAAGAEVVGVSGDSVENHKLFKEVWKLNFTLLADEQGKIAKKFGVRARSGGTIRPRGPDRQYLKDDKGRPLTLERAATFARCTFVIGKDGKIAYKNTKVHPTKDTAQVLEFIQNQSAMNQGE